MFYSCIYVVVVYNRSTTKNFSPNINTMRSAKSKSDSARLVSNDVYLALAISRYMQFFRNISNNYQKASSRNQIQSELSSSSYINRRLGDGRRTSCDASHANSVAATDRRKRSLRNEVLTANNRELQNQISYRFFGYSFMLCELNKLPNACLQL